MRTDAFEWMTEELKRFSHRPGVKITLHREYGWSGPQVYMQVTMPVVDVYHPEAEVKDLGIRSAVPIGIIELMPDDARSEPFADLVLKTVLLAEQHEAREWLRRDGVAVSDPHRHVAPITDFVTTFTYNGGSDAHQ